MATKANDEIGDFFGGMDADLIGDNPFYIAEDTYWCVCTKADIKIKEDGYRQLSIVWSIDSPESEFYGNTVRQTFSLLEWPADRKKAEEFWNALSGKEKKSQKFLNKLLTEGFDLTPEQKRTLKASSLEGKEAFVTVKERPGKDRDGNDATFSNAVAVLCRRLYEEKNGQQDSNHVSADVFGV